MRKLLVTVTIANREYFSFQSKTVTYIGVFFEFFNQSNYRQVYVINKRVGIKEMYSLTRKKFFKIYVYQIIEIFFALNYPYIISKNQEKLIFYLNNHID